MATVKNREFNQLNNIKDIREIDTILLQTSDDTYHPTGKYYKITKEQSDKLFIGNQAWVAECYKNEDEECILHFAFVFCNLGFWVGNMSAGFGSKQIPENVWVPFQQELGIDAKKTETIVMEKVTNKIQEENPFYEVKDSRKKIIDPVQRMSGKAKQKAIKEYEDILYISPKKRTHYCPDLIVVTDRLNSNKNIINEYFEIELSGIRHKNHKTNFKIKLLKAALTKRDIYFIISDEHYYDYIEAIEEFYFENNEKYSIERWKAAKLSDYLERGSNSFTKI